MDTKTKAKKSIAAEILNSHENASSMALSSVKKFLNPKISFSPGPIYDGPGYYLIDPPVQRDRGVYYVEPCAQLDRNDHWYKISGGEQADGWVVAEYLAKYIVRKVS